jgi:exopolysaccharide biosynthesis polyprenyl glycosylphosphotransferase
LAIGDLTALFAPMGLSWAALNTRNILDADDLWKIGVAGVLGLVLSSSGSLYDLGSASSLRKTHRATFCAIILVFIMRSLYADPAPGLSIVDKYRYAFLAIVAVALWRSAYALAARTLQLSRRVLVIGAGVAGTLLAEEINSRKELGEYAYSLVGFVDDDPDKCGETVAGAPVLGPSTKVRDLILAHQVDTIALAVNREPVISADVFQALLDARETGANVVSMPVLYEDLARKVALTHVGQNWGVTFPVEHTSKPLLHDVFARTIDTLSGIFGCVIVAFVAPLLMLANKIQSPGPLFYSQLRVGRGGRLFRIYKFRSMIVNAETKGAVWCAENDSRITKLGHFLRKTRIDELPQFWNVLKGEMSLIGPRPERPEFVDILAQKIPFYRARHAVKPGLTGWAQVMYRYGACEEDSLVKLEYDLYYVKHRSVMLDLLILAKSVKTVLAGAGR